jgi:hypothetical protein
MVSLFRVDAPEEVVKDELIKHELRLPHVQKQNGADVIADPVLSCGLAAAAG